MPADTDKGASLLTGSIQVRAYKPGDELVLNRLFNEVFSRARTLQEWHWKFHGNPVAFSSETPITIAEVGGEIVAQWANMPMRFRFRDRIVLTTQAVDNLVHQGFRAGGRLQLELLARQPDLARAAGVIFGFGFPDQVAYLMGKWILKYQDLFPLPTLFRRLSWRLALKRRFGRVPGWMLELAGFLGTALGRLSSVRWGTHGVFVTEAPSFDESCEALWQRAKDSYGIQAVRDLQYLRWRYDAKPAGGYTKLLAERHGDTVGYVVLKVKQEGDALVGLIVDLLSIPDEAVDRALVREALRQFAVRGVDYVLCRILKQDRVYRALQHYGFREHPTFSPVPVVYYLFSKEIDEGFLKDPHHWHLMFGDSDDA